MERFHAFEVIPGKECALHVPVKCGFHLSIVALPHTSASGRTTLYVSVDGRSYAVSTLDSKWNILQVATDLVFNAEQKTVFYAKGSCALHCVGYIRELDIEDLTRLGDDESDGDAAEMMGGQPKRLAVTPASKKPLAQYTSDSEEEEEGEVSEDDLGLDEELEEETEEELHDPTQAPLPSSSDDDSDELLTESGDDELSDNPPNASSEDDSDNIEPPTKMLRQGGSPHGRPSQQGGSPHGRPSQQGGSPHGRPSQQGGSPHGRPSQQGGSPHGRPSQQGGSPHGRPSQQGGSPHGRPSQQGGSPMNRSSKQSGSPHGRPSQQGGIPNGIREQMLSNPSPIVYDRPDDACPRSEQVAACDDDSVEDPIDNFEIFEIIRGIRDPEHPFTLEQLKVVEPALITVNWEERTIKIFFTPTVPHCSLTAVIGLSILVKLERSLPQYTKVDVYVAPGTHDQEEQVNKQLNDKERVAAALENPSLMNVVESCINFSE